MIQIRDVRDEDLPALVTLVTSVLAEFGFDAKASAVEDDLRAARDRYGRARAGFWVAEVDGAVAGSVAIRPKDDVTCEIKRLYLRPDVRGRGLGQALYEHAERFARGAGYARMWLDSSRRFAKAHALYVRNGFVLVESLDNDWEDDVFEKRLT